MTEYLQFDKALNLNEDEMHKSLTDRYGCRLSVKVISGMTADRVGFFCKFCRK